VLRPDRLVSGEAQVIEREADFLRGLFLHKGSGELCVRLCIVRAAYFLEFLFLGALTLEVDEVVEPQVTVMRREVLF
jgi:hypothetical protein